MSTELCTYLKAVLVSSLAWLSSGLSAMCDAKVQGIRNELPGSSIHGPDGSASLIAEHHALLEVGFCMC